MERVRSVNGVPIRLSSERWQHIVESHDYLAVVYKELSPDDGFIISAYFTDRLDRRKRVWPK